MKYRSFLFFFVALGDNVYAYPCKHGKYKAWERGGWVENPITRNLHNSAGTNRYPYGPQIRKIRIPWPACTLRTLDLTMSMASWIKCFHVHVSSRNSSFMRLLINRIRFARI